MLLQVKIFAKFGFLGNTIIYEGNLKWMKFYSISPNFKLFFYLQNLAIYTILIGLNVLKN